MKLRKLKPPKRLTGTPFQLPLFGILSEMERLQQQQIDQNPGKLPHPEILQFCRTEEEAKVSRKTKREQNKRTKEFRQIMNANGVRSNL